VKPTYEAYKQLDAEKEVSKVEAATSGLN